MKDLVIKLIYGLWLITQQRSEKVSHMETPMVSQESEVCVAEPVAPKKLEAVNGDFNGSNLEAAVKNVVEEIRQCDEQANLWLEKKRQLQEKMNETLERIQKQFNGVAVPEKKAPRAKFDKNASVPDLIRTFLDKNGPSRTKDIRKFLLSHGRRTNPGVALGRMVKNGDLKHTGRGVYGIA